MLFQTPDTEGWAPAKGDQPASTLAEVARDAWATNGIGGSTLTDAGRAEEAIDAHNDRVFQITGQRLLNPLRHSQVGQAAAFASGGMAVFLPEVDHTKEWRSKLEQLAVAMPELRDQIKPDFDPLKEAGRAVQAADKRLASSLERSPWTANLPIVGPVNPAALAAGLPSMLTDPLQGVALLAGGHVGVGAKQVIWGGIKSAVANGAAAAIEQPFVKAWRNSAGLDYSWGDAAHAVMAAGAFGFAADAGLRGVTRAVRNVRGKVPEVDAKGNVVGWHWPEADAVRAKANGDPVAALDEAARNAPEGSALARAAAGDADALEELARQTGAHVDLAVRGALSALRDDPVAVVPAGVSAVEHGRLLDDATRAAADPLALPPGDAPPSVTGAAMAEADVAAMLRRDPVDIAAEIRDRPELLGEGYPWSDHHLRTAAQLAKLSDDGFDRVAAGAAPPELAAIVAEHVADRSRHADLLDALIADRPSSPETARARLADLLHRPRTATEHGMVAGVDVVDRPVHLIDDPYGPDATRQLEQLRQTHAAEIAAATGEGQKAAEQPAAAEYRDPATNLPIPADDVQSMVDMWRYASETLAAKRPQSITQWLIELGRVQDQGGELTNMLGGKARHLISGKGKTLDAAAEAAWEAGFFHGDRPTVRDLLDAIDDDLRGNHRYRAIDERLVDDIAVARDMMTELDQLGVGNAKSEADIRKHFAASEGRAGAQGGAAAAGSPQRVGANASDAAVAAEKVTAARNADIQTAIDEALAKLPRGVTVKSFAELRDLPQFAQDSAKRAGMTIDRIAGLTETETGNIWISRDAIDPRGVLAHETIHALVERGVLTDAELSVLASAAAKIPNLFDREAYARTYAGRDQAARHMMQEDAAHLYEARAKGGDYGRSVNAIIDRVRQFMERVRNALAGRGYRSAEDVMRGIDRGVMAVREAQPGAASAEPMFAMVDTSVGQSMRRDLDALGYFSGALEAAKRLKQAKGTPEQMLAMLQKEGAKKAEIEATGLGKFLEGRPSVTRDEIVSHLEGNRLGLNEVKYGGVDASPDTLDHIDATIKEIRDTAEIRGGQLGVDLRRAADQIERQRQRDPMEFDNEAFWEGLTNNEDVAAAISAAQDNALEARSRPKPADAKAKAKWSAHSLDPSNPTYRETVLHLPDEHSALTAQRDKLRGMVERGEITPEQYYAQADPITKSLDGPPQNFQSGHFPEPNIVGHMMTSMTKHEGKPVYTIDQIQSDWGQKLRDGGVRDEAKIADLRRQMEEIDAKWTEGATYKKELNAAAEKYGDRPRMPQDVKDRLDALDRAAYDTRPDRANPDYRRIAAEWEQASRIETPGHPLVNTTDQWSNATLRRAIRQAAEADAEYIAIPHGDTVLSYNPGDDHGMRSFYGSRSVEGIVPKNLRKMLSSLDANLPKPQRIEQLETSAGPQGWNTAQSYRFDKSQTGFTLFPLTEKVKIAVKEDGLPLFSLRADAADLLRADLDAAKLLTDAKAKAQKERQALIDEGVRKANERFVTSFRDARGQVDPAKGLMHLIESHGETPLPEGMVSVVAEAKAIEAMAKAGMEEFLNTFRPQLGTGVTRNTARLTNVVREMAGEATSDAAARGLAQMAMRAMERLRQEFNAAGGDIQKLAGWFLPQVHDRAALLKAGPVKWVDDILPRLALERIVDGETGQRLSVPEIRAALADIWQNITSDGHGTQAANARDAFGGIKPDGGGATKLGNQRQEHRFLHFKSADDWLAYQKAYGGGADPFRAVMAHVTSMSKDIAAMRVLGTNPDRELARLARFVEKQAALARPAEILIDEATSRIKELNRKLLAAPRRIDEVTDGIGRVLKDLDTLRRKRIGPPSRRTRAKMDVLRDELTSLEAERSRLLDGDAIETDGIEAAKIRVALDAAHDDLLAVQDADRVLFPRVTEFFGKEMRHDGFWATDPEDYARAAINRAEQMWAQVRGSASAPVNQRFATNMQTARNVGVIGRGGSMVISSMADNFTQILARRFTGLPAAATMTDILRQFGPESRRDAHRQALIGEAYLHMWNDGARNAASLHGAEWSQYLAERTIALQGLGALTDAQRMAFGMSLQAALADMAHLSLAELTAGNANLGRLWKRYGLSAADWDAIRLDPATGQSRQVDFLSPNLVRDSMDAAGRGAERIAERYLGMILQESDFASPTSMLRARAVMTGGTRPGTIAGELLRVGGQFKGFAVMMWMLHVERAAREMIAAGGLGVRGLKGAGYAAQMALVTTLGGALVLQLKELKSYKDPQPMDNAKFWARAAVQGGGLGLMGDLFVAETNRFGGGLVSTVGGPVVGMAEDVARPIVELATAKHPKPGRAAAKLATSYVPGSSLWYFAGGYNRVIANSVQKALDPEAHRSFLDRERAQERDYGNRYFWGLGDSAPRRGPNFISALGR